jgi:hypothetical protein
VVGCFQEILSFVLIVAHSKRSPSPVNVQAVGQKCFLVLNSVQVVDTVWGILLLLRRKRNNGSVIIVRECFRNHTMMTKIIIVATVALLIWDLLKYKKYEM